MRRNNPYRRRLLEQLEAEYDAHGCELVKHIVDKYAPLVGMAPRGPSRLEWLPRVTIEAEPVGAPAEDAVPARAGWHLPTPTLGAEGGAAAEA